MLSTHGVTLMAKMMAGISTMPTSLWLALLTTPAVASDAGNTIIEPVAADYSRTELIMGDPFWYTPFEGEAFTYYTQEISYYPNNNWGSIVAFALCDAATNGNVIHYGDLVNSMSMVSFSQVIIPAYSISIQAL